MDYFDTLKGLANEQGVTLTALAAANGFSRAYISSAVRQGRTPSLTVANELAAPLGYQLALVPRDAPPDGALLIDAPRRDA